MVEITPVLGALITLALFIIGGLISWGVTKTTIAFNAAQIKEIKDDIKEIKENCSLNRKECQSMLCKKIDNLNKTIITHYIEIREHIAKHG